LTTLIRKRFDELIAQADAVAATRARKFSEYSPAYEELDSDLLLGWCVKARNLLATACGRESEHFTAFVAAEQVRPYEYNVSSFGRVRSIFLAAKEDFEGGYLASVRNLVQAEVFSSELDQARELLAAGYLVAAAVICGVVLETNLRGLCDQRGIACGKLDKMNADLAKAGEYNSLIQKRITALAAIRNSAAHGKAADFGESDVRSMIDDVERLVSGWLT
jgi:hypothetical protein